MANPITEKVIFTILGTLLLFLLINFNQTLGIIYIFMLVIDFIIFQTDSFVSFRTETKTNNRFEAIAWGAIGYGVFIFIGSFTIGALAPQALIDGNFVQSILQTQAANVPALSDSQILTIVAWGFLIPILETRFFFGRLMEFISDQTNIKLELNQKGAWIIMVLVAGIFTIFHLTAKSAQGNAALILTFIFAMVSMIMVLRFKELKQATVVHVLSNTIAVLTKLGIMTIGF